MWGGGCWQRTKTPHINRPEAATLLANSKFWQAMVFPFFRHPLSLVPNIEHTNLQDVENVCGLDFTLEVMLRVSTLTGQWSYIHWTDTPLSPAPRLPAVGRSVPVSPLSAVLSPSPRCRPFCPRLPAVGRSVPVSPLSAVLSPSPRCRPFCPRLPAVGRSVPVSRCRPSVPVSPLSAVLSPSPRCRPFCPRLPAVGRSVPSPRCRPFCLRLPAVGRSVPVSPPVGRSVPVSPPVGRSVSVSPLSAVLFVQ